MTFDLEGGDSNIVLVMSDAVPIKTPQMSMKKGLELSGKVEKWL